MKLFTTLLFFTLARFSCAQTQDGSDVLASAVANLAPCALNCTVTTISASTCELTDLVCVKANEKMLAELSVCVKSSCTIKESLTAKRFLQDLLGTPVRDKTRVGTHTCLIVGGLAVLSFVLRGIARLPMFGGQWGIDDWAMTASITIIIPLTICAFLLNEIGMGKDMWYVPFDNITKILEIFYFTELLYLTAIGLTKISILLFYLRIFPNQGLRRIIYFTILLCVLYIIAFVTATALQCLPISLAWNRWDGEHGGKCFNLNADAWASAGINIVLDLIVICLPIREIQKLSMSRRRRFAIMLMFLIGGFVTVISMLRLKYMVQFAHTENVTWDYLPIGIWSAVETQVGVIVACMPAMRSLQGSIRARLFPKPDMSTKMSEEYSKNSSRKKSFGSSGSRVWPSRSDRSRLSMFTRTTSDKEDFVLLNEFELAAAPGGKTDAMGISAAAQDSSEGSLSQSWGSSEDVRPLAAAPATDGMRPSGIMVQTEYSVNSGHQRQAEAGRRYQQSLPHYGDPLSQTRSKGDPAWQVQVSSPK